MIYIKLLTYCHFPEIQAINKINDVIEEGSTMEVLASLQQPTARLRNVDVKNGACYHSLLKQCKRQKAEVGDIKMVF